MKPDKPVFDAVWRQRTVVTTVERSEADWMVRRHYLHKWPGVVVMIVGMQCDGEILGTIVFALPPRETIRRYGGLTWELARLWIDDRVPQNGETYLISRAVRLVRKLRPDVRCLVSYADPSVGHHGTIYRAAGWRSDGRTDDDRKTPRFDYEGEDGKHYSRRSHIPEGTPYHRVPRVSKPRYILPL